MPSALASCSAFWHSLALVPYATKRYSASSVMNSSKRTSFSSISLYLAISFWLNFSCRSGSRSSEVIIFLGRDAGFPVVAHGSISSDLFFCGLSHTFSIICPMAPSERIITGFLYLNARSNPSSTKSAISWTDAGASTSR